MKSVLISIRPKWCELIASGKKTIEVRKSAPKEVPFKCYIYATKPKKWFRFSSCGYASDECLWLLNGKVEMGDGFKFWADGDEYQCLNGQVIGEFVCDKVVRTCGWRLRGDTQQCAKRTVAEAELPKLACLAIDEIVDYAGSENREVVGWHISDLKIYEKPRELSELYNACDTGDKVLCENCDQRFNRFCNGRQYIKRAPQSWCYVDEEIEKREVSLDYWLGADLDESIDMS